MPGLSSWRDARALGTFTSEPLHGTGSPSGRSSRSCWAPGAHGGALRRSPGPGTGAGGARGLEQIPKLLSLSGPPAQARLPGTPRRSEGAPATYRPGAPHTCSHPVRIPKRRQDLPDRHRHHPTPSPAGRCVRGSRFNTASPEETQRSAVAPEQSLQVAAVRRVRRLRGVKPLFASANSSPPPCRAASPSGIGRGFRRSARA